MSSKQAQAGESKPAENKLWGGRFTGISHVHLNTYLHVDGLCMITGGLDPLMDAYNESLSYDREFYAHDIDGSIAWARANKDVGILTEKEFKEIERGFSTVRKEWETNTFKILPGIDEVR